MQAYKVLLVVALLATSGCAVVTTKIQEPKHTKEVGQVYWLPRRDIVVTATLTATVPSMAVDRTEAYADNRDGKAYIVQFHANQLGTNDLTIGVNSRGLLQSSKAQYTSTLLDALQDVAPLKIQTVPGRPILPAAAGCPANGSLTFVVRPEEPSVPKSFLGYPECIVSVRITTLEDAASVRQRDGHNAESGAANGSEPVRPDPFPISAASHAGLFYRQEIPYVVEVTWGNWQQTAYAFLPNGSQTRFLPIKKGLFANNTADFTFSDGSPTKYGQTVDSEFLALLKLPANIVKAYFGAIGAVFSAKKEVASSEKDYVGAINDLLLKQYDSQACMRALAQKNDAEISAVCK